MKQIKLLSLMLSALICATFLVAIVQASENVMQPGPSEGKDTYVRAITPYDNYSNEWLIKVEGPLPDNNPGNAYLQFDLSSIPSSTTIKSAELKLYQYASYPFTASASRVTADWNELTLTYNNRPPNSTVESTTELPYNNDESNSGWITFDITEMRQQEEISLLIQIE